MRKPERKGLGRGLSALLADSALTADGDAEAPRRPDIHLPIERIRPNPDQPRRHFDAEELAELAESIRQKGILQPIIVRPDPRHPGDYQIVAGERRWRAAQEARLHEIPALVRDLSDSEVLEFGIIENIQRADLNPVEEAAGYRQLMERFGHTQEQLAAAMGKSRSHIANLLRLLNLPPEVQDWLREGKLTAGHARTLVTAPDPVRLGAEIIRRGLTVREAEKLARSQGQPRRAGERRPAKDADTRALEADLSAQIGLPVSIEDRGNGSGQLRISYRSLEELDALCRLLSRPD
ncbi:MAG: ParB/RepB/Spo0J family partition protein [Alphaproteobacteria bacterium]|nr:MAG: ParB/RepB/Spo0J family partition protein [Alphaproteobacteria bacterium]